MKAWEFLLQKEGDQTWLPLETPTVEILEGRYRIVVRTPCKDAEVDIYISYVSTQDDPPKRRVQQRSRQTNPDGLMAFLPFTPFRTGRWELRCRPHVAPGSFEHPWPASLELQVLEPEAPAQASDLFDWDAPEAPAQAAPVTQAAALESGSEIQRLAQQMSRMVVDSVLSAAESLSGAGPTETGIAGASESASEVASEAETAPSAPASLETAEGLETAATAPPQILISLREETLTFGGDRTVTLSGELQPTAPWNDPLVLSLELRDPSTTEIWDSQSIPFPASPVLAGPDTRSGGRPAALAFAQTFTIPTSCASPLLLGIATLWRSRDLEAIAAAQFTVIASVETLLSQVAATETQPPEAGNGIDALQQRAASNFVVGKMGMQPTPARANRQVNTDLLGLLGKSQEAAQSPRNFRPVPPQQLPPKLEPRPTSPPSGPQRELDLPSFGRSRSQASGDSRHNPIFQWTPPKEIPQPGDPSNVDLGDPSNVDLGDPSNLDLNLNLGETENIQPTREEPLAETPAEFATLTETTTPSNVARPTWLPPQGESSLTDAFAIPEEATLEELAELFGPPPNLGLETEPAVEPASALRARVMPEMVLDLEPAIASLTSNDLAPNDSNDDSFPPNPLSLASAQGTEQATEREESPEELREGSPEEALDLEPELDAPRALTYPGDPLMNRLHELVIPQPQLPQESPALLTEVVVDDEDLPATRMAWMQARPQATSLTDIAIETPEMKLPEGDLVVGETIRVVLRVPTEPPQLCARIWLLDCQTRTLLTEPQWVTAFLPLSSEQLEATVDLRIPEGSIELQVEAIAVDPNSQRESRKVTIRRTVVLAGEPETLAEKNRFNPWMS